MHAFSSLVMSKPGILFLCIGNSCRSQMAEGWMRHYGAEKIVSFSAGISPSFVHPIAIQVMKEKGIDISDQTSKGVSDIDLDKITHVASLCGEADEVCPVFSRPVPVLRWHQPDPIRIVGSEEARLNAFREVRDNIEHEVKEFLKKL